MRRAAVIVVSIMSVVLSASSVRAQMYESVGTRAQGMGGAFTAVADDGTASWWNPAGIAAGPYFDTLVEYGRPETPAGTSVQGLAVAFPALALSYYRLPVSQMRPASTTAAAVSSRQDQGYLSQFGATVGQSIGGHLVVAATLKLLRAGDTHADVDVGALVTAGHLRLGVSMRNLRQTTFTDGLDSWSLKRTSRAGIAVTGKGGRLFDGVTVAADADLTRVATYAGDEQHVSAGAEAWLFRRVIGLRGGLSTDTVTNRSAGSAGMSAMLQSSRYTKTYLEGQFTGGSDQVRRGWGGSVRLTF